MPTKTTDVRQCTSQGEPCPIVDKMEQMSQNTAFFDFKKNSYTLTFKMGRVSSILAKTMDDYAPEFSLEDVQEFARQAWWFIREQSDDAKKSLLSCWFEMNDTLKDYQDWLEAVDC